MQNMAKRLTKEEKWRKASEDLINKMFEIAGHDVTFDDIYDRCSGRAVERVGDGVPTEKYEAQHEACRYGDENV